MKTELKDKEQIAHAAPFAVSGAVGAEFWNEVERRDAARAGQIQPRPSTEKP